MAHPSRWSHIVRACTVCRKLKMKCLCEDGPPCKASRLPTICGLDSPDGPIIVERYLLIHVVVAFSTEMQIGRA